MKNTEIIIALKEQFAKECEVIELRYEYGKDYTGTEKYGIITNLSEKELMEKYKVILDEMTPYILLPPKFAIIRRDYRRNEKKFEMRYLRGNYYPIDDEFDEHHPEITNSDPETEFLCRERKIKLYSAIQRLKPPQKERLVQAFIYGMSSREIAENEGVNYSTVDKSIKCAINNLKKFLK